MDAPTFEARNVTFTGDDGEQYNAWDYLVQEGNLACFSSWGSHTFQCAEVACLLHEIYVYSGSDDSVDALEGCMSMVVNESDGIAYLIAENAALVGADPNDWLDDYDREDAAEYARRNYEDVA